MRWFLLLLWIFAGLHAAAQKKSALVSGTITDENDRPIASVTINILGRNTGILSSDSGAYQMQLRTGKPIALVFSHSGFITVQKNLYLNPGEEEILNVRMLRQDKTLETVEVKDDKQRQQTGLIVLDPENAQMLPSATGGVEGLIKILVGSNNELTSQYSVRGGNYDENLIYINDFEIFRPYLIRNGQQEGLSFINPELVKNIRFYNGGFQAVYGDKISSVLDIEYRQPQHFGGSVYVSLLEQGAHLEGKTKNLSWMVGVRSKTNRNLLSSQEVKGNYLPSAADVQAMINWQINDKLLLQVLGIVSGSSFDFIPQSAEKTTSVFSPLFSANLGLDIYFEGQEKDQYFNNLVGISLEQKINSRLTLKWLTSRYGDREHENFDIAGAYLFGERSFDKSKPDFGEIVNPLGAGVFHNYARNELKIENYNLSHKGSFHVGKHFIQWGAGWDHTLIHDRLYEWERQDSAGYTIPFDPQQLRLTNFIQSSIHLQTDKFHTYLQDNVRWGSGGNIFTLQGGVRLNYNGLNNELLISPRAQFSLKPDWRRDMVFKLAAGVYSQPPFYRELRRPDGSINKDLKAQKSIQFVVGMDYNTVLGSLPFRITTEAYFKDLRDVITYDIDNVRIRYSGENNARAYAMGIETRIFTELVKDAESWLSINVSRTMEDLENDTYYLYKNAAGEIITSQTSDQIVEDSVQKEMGYIRRPTDRLITIGLFLQDYLSTNKNFKVHLNMIYGSNMTYNIPGSVRYRNALIIEPYIRVDVGFSALLLSDQSLRRSHSPFRGFDNIWASLEVFNIIDRANVISYQLIKDFANNTFSIPNRLTPRLINFKLLARF